MRSRSCGFVTNSSTVVFNIKFKPNDLKETADMFYYYVEEVFKRLPDEITKRFFTEFAKKLVRNEFQLTQSVEDYNDYALEAMDEIIAILKKLEEEGKGTLSVCTV